MSRRKLATVLFLLCGIGLQACVVQPPANGAGTLRAAAEQLPRLKSMHVDIVWLMPIHPIGEQNRKGSLGSPYAVKDYYGVNPEFGTLEDLRHFVQTAHDLDCDRPGVREYMTEALKYWVREADIDGYRCDVAGFVPVDFWNHVRAELERIKPVFMLAEWESRDLHAKDAIDWRPHPIGQLYTQLFKLKKANTALWNGAAGARMIRVWNSSPDRVFSFVRENAQDKVLVAINFSDAPQSVTFTAALHEGRYREVFSGQTVTLDSASRLAIEPWGYRVFVR